MKIIGSWKNYKEGTQSKYRTQVQNKHSRVITDFKLLVIDVFQNRVPLKMAIPKMARKLNMAPYPYKNKFCMRDNIFLRNIT